MVLTLDRRVPLHFIGVGGIGMSALAAILAARGFQISGSDPRDSPTMERLRSCGVRVFCQQNPETISALRQSSQGEPVVVVSSAVPPTNPELEEAKRLGWAICHRSDVLAALIGGQPSIAVAGSHGKTTTSTLIATLLEAVGEDPTAVIGGVVPAFGGNGRHGDGRLLVAEADESDGSLVKFAPDLAVITNLELDHTDHYPDLASLVATLQEFARRSRRLLANRDCEILRDHFEAHCWWSTVSPDEVQFAAIAREERGDGTVVDFYENGERIGVFELPLPGRHNLSNAAAAMAACRLEGVPFESLRQAISGLQPPGRRFDCRGVWLERIIVDDYAHHPSEVAATLAMARLMVQSGRSTLPVQPRRVVAVFQPHRYSRTAQFLEEFAAALATADAVLLAPLYGAGEAPLAGISSAALAERILAGDSQRSVGVAETMDQLASLVASTTLAGDLVLAMGAGDVNGLWDRLGHLPEGGLPVAMAA